MDTIELNGMDIETIDSVMRGLRAIQNQDSNVRINSVTFTIYDEHRCIVSRRGKWQPMVLRKIRKVLQ